MWRLKSMLNYNAYLWLSITTKTVHMQLSKMEYIFETTLDVDVFILFPVYEQIRTYQLQHSFYLNRRNGI